MRLTRRQRRDLTALGQQLAREDPDLAAQLSQPAEPAPRPRRRHSHAGVLIGQVLFVLGLLMIVWGALTSTPAAITIGVIVLLACWVPWQYGSQANRR
ncbi:DUF3040 domain-containing protein [Pseudonocardia kujensis]|uniref:DUF3040 domain-containing protein n=1 Tax=Pseudonocardia kujensis TaxID=1128675 RepID=UPI001E3F8FC9|nr:DUF3040 domain-containing protein [Pseudonocardia kujensis]MCE0764390.1 DUF3040 domain-containing protein [Pseudonocardia kujensis]